MKKELSFYLPKKSKKIELPLFLAKVKAGFPSPADDFLDQKLDLNEHLISHPAATFFVRVEGDSMNDAHIYKDDILIVDKAIDARDQNIVIALINQEFTVKRLRIKNKDYFLQPANPNYPLIKIDPESEFQIWGVVTYIIHKA